MKFRRSMNFKTYARAVVAIAHLISWSLAAFTGFLLWLTSVYRHPNLLE